MRALSRRMGGMSAACLALAAMLLGTSTVLAAEAGPDNPRKHYWLRSTGARVVEAGPMDARLREIGDVFGRGELEQARILAEELLAATEDGNLRAEAAAFIVQSHLAEGDFGSARAAAERVNGIEADYKAEVGRLQRIVATTKDPAEAARAQLLTARAHQGACQLGLAERSYWKVIQRYPGCPEAGDSLWQVTQLHRMRGDVAGAIRSCVLAGERAPNSSFIAAVAAERMASLSFSHDQVGEGTALLLDLSRRFPRTVLSAWARFRLGDLYWRADRPDEAADAWQDVWGIEPHADQVPGLLDCLAEARYEAATRARALGRSELALVHLAFLSEMPETEWRRQHVLPASLTLDMAECHLASERWQDALGLARRSHDVKGQPGDTPRALYVEGCARWGLGEYDRAARAWQKAMAEYPATEYGEKSRAKMRP